jgi:hypothetical protein
LFTNAFPNVSNYIGDFEFGLAGGGELLRLYNETGDLIDNVDYNDNDPWPEAADGDGPTLELIDAMSDNSFAENWAPSNGFGTPGSINSVSLLGDINEDGVLNILDVVLLVNIILSGDYNSVASSVRLRPKTLLIKLTMSSTSLFPSPFRSAKLL